MGRLFGKGKIIFLGYYVHLLTDVLWKEKITDPSMQRFSELFEKDKDAIWKLKEDWYDLDHLFLKRILVSVLFWNTKMRWDSPIPL